MAKDSTMLYIEDDIEKVQVKTNLYLKAYGSMGAFHLVKELVQNDVDECEDPDSDGRNITVIIDKLEDSIITEDDGRGIPEVDYPLDICCTKLQSGSKFVRDSNTKTAGEFGVGLCVVNALSESFTMTSYREKEKTVHMISFKHGKKIADEKRSIQKGEKKHGLITKMIPSKKYLGKDTSIPVDTVEKWLEQISYFFEDGIKLEFIIREGFKEISSKVYTKRDPIGLLEDICSDAVMFKPICIERTDNFEEEILNTDPKIKAETVIKQRSATYGLMFTYDDSIDPCYDSYCNFSNTVQGGVHMDSAEKAFCTYIQKATKDSLTEKEKQTVDILWNDIRTGLKMVVYLNTNANVEFEGNVKEKIKAELLRPILYNGFTDDITSYFDKNPEKLKLVVKIIKTNAKARIEATKARVASIKENMNPLKELQIKNYDRALNNGKYDYREIFIVEGDSAGTCAGRCRIPDIQAIFAVRGMTVNPLKTTLIKLMDPVTGNKEVRALVSVLRCGWGRNFDITKLWFKKIIIMTDADIDGFGITSMLCVLFIIFFPELVEAGFVYKALPPLYEIKVNGKSKFLRNKEEYVNTYRDNVINYYDVIIPLLGKKELSRDVFRTFLYETSDYLGDLKSIAGHFKTSYLFVERIASFLVWKYPNMGSDFDLKEILSDQKFLTEFMSTIQKVYPEIKYDEVENKLYGVADGHHTTLETGNRFVRKIQILLDTYRNYGYSILVKEKDDEFKQMTLAMFNDKYQKFIPKIGERFKGLGEMKPENLFETTMNPNSRVLIQLKLSDLKEEMKIFNKLHGNTKKDKEARKKMMKEFHIRPEDLDN